MTAVMDKPQTTENLPKYLQRANQILEILAAQPEQTWVYPQRELGERLGISQPQLSALLKYLFENGRIRKGAKIPRVRGKNYKIILADDTPFTAASPRAATHSHEDDEDRPLHEGESLPGALDLSHVTVEQLGAGVIRALQQSWRNEVRHAEIRSEQMTRLREYREQLTSERRLRGQLATEKEDLERRLHELEHVQGQLREQINKLIMRTHDGGERGQYKLVDLADEESLRIFENLLRETPGRYRESDAEVGLR